MTNLCLKRIFLFTISSILYVVCTAQTSNPINFSGIILSNDSVPLPDVAIVNPTTGKTVRTNGEGFFQTQIGKNDSLFVYHIAYKRIFLHLKDNNGRLYMIPEAYDLHGINVYEDSASIKKKMDVLSSDIKRIAFSKKLEGYDRTSRQENFYFDNSVRRKAMSPYFGPTAGISFGQIAKLFGKLKKKKEKKERLKEESLQKLQSQKIKLLFLDE